MKIGQVLGWIWLVITIIVMIKAYYELFIDFLRWLKKKTHKAEGEQAIEL